MVFGSKLKLPAATRFGLLLFGLILCLAPFLVVGAQGSNGITEPTEEDTISGIVIIRGSAADPNFMRYELAFRSSATQDWIVFAQGDQPVRDGTLAVWDTTVGRESTPVFPDGIYQLRLRVVRTDFNYDEYFASRIVVSNDEPTPTPTPDAAESEEVQSGGPEVQSTVIATVGPLPSLTPFPTPSPRATPLESVGRTGEENDPTDGDSSRGVLNQLSNLDTSGFSRAFWNGALIVAIIFAALAAYLLFRGVFRRVWRFVQTKIFR